MSSTEFTVGHEGVRNSSKVLKPPGGGSSDIFGLGTTSSGNQHKDLSTKNRLFGSEPAQANITPRKDRGTILGNDDTPITRSTKKAYVPRNPITGEGMGLESTESSEKEKENIDDNEKSAVESEVKPESVAEIISEATTIPKAVTTSIRVRNPPGGKSSIIF